MSGKITVFDDSYTAGVDLSTHQYKAVKLTGARTIGLFNTGVAIGVLAGQAAPGGRGACDAQRAQQGLCRWHRDGDCRGRSTLPERLWGVSQGGRWARKPTSLAMRKRLARLRAA